MANPANLTVTQLAANAAANQPAAQIIDTNGTVAITAEQAEPMDRLICEFVNAAIVGITVTIKAGQTPPSMIPADLAVTLAAAGSAGDKQIAGPFESGRFLKADGSVDVQFQATSGAPNLAVRIYQLQKI